MKIKLSKSQWEMVGRKAGWMKSAQSAFTGYGNPKKSYDPEPVADNGMKGTTLIAYRNKNDGKHHYVIEYEIGSGRSVGPSPGENYHKDEGETGTIFFQSREEAETYIKKFLSSNIQSKRVPYEVLLATLKKHNLLNKVPCK